MCKYNLLSKAVLTKPYTFMSGSIITGFSNYTAPAFKAMDSSHYGEFTEFFKDCAVHEHDLKKSMGRIAKDLEQLKIKYQSNRSQSLAEIIQKKEKTLEALNQVVSNAREAYFSQGQAISDKVQAYLNIAV